MGTRRREECSLMGVSGKASERRHSLSLTSKDQKTSTALPLPKNYSLSMPCSLLGTVERRQEGMVVPVLRKCTACWGASLALLSPLELCVYRWTVGVGERHGVDLEIQGFPSYYSPIWKAAHFLQEEFLPCNVFRGPVRRFPSHCLVSSTWFCIGVS